MTSSGRSLVVGDLGFDVLRAAYRTGSATPAGVIAEVYDRIGERGEDGVWISLVPRADAIARASALDPGSDLPLLGLPFAVKDNVDVAGMETTAACPGFAYVASVSAPLVDALLDAGAVLVGKTNLDQFATGLSGARSPYGTPSAVGDPDLISGGSSSGSAVAVAAGLVSFTIGTDTAGSGRVPAALNGVVGVKPSVGLVSTDGVVPACRSLDCASVFAGTVAEASAVLAVIARTRRPGSRSLPRPAAAPAPVNLRGLRIAVPAVVEDWGDRGEEAAWRAWCARLVEAGVELVPVDPAPFLEAGALLYDGPWVAERLSGVGDFVEAEPDALLEVTRTILRSGLEVSGTDVFAGAARLEQLRRSAHAVLADADALLTPTVTRTFTIAEMVADPVALNSRLGRWTTFTNLLDLCAVALPAGGGPGAPFGVTLQAPAGRDAFLAGLAHALEGAPAPGVPAGEWTSIAVVGAHLSGMPLHGDLTDRGAVLEERTTTADCYRLLALAGGPPARPGLRRVAQGGAAIEVEVYRMPTAEVGRFLAGVPAPLGLGTVLLADGRGVTGFVCEEAGFAGAEDVTRHGGWRAYLAHAAV